MMLPTRRRILQAGAMWVAPGPGALKLAIAGLTHGHARGFLRQMAGRTDVELVGICDPDAALRARYAEAFSLPAARLYPSVEAMLGGAKPDAVAAFSSTFDHPEVVEACAAHRLPVMMEKPLAVSNEHARRIATAASKSGIPVVVNYETTWYRSHAAIWRTLVEEQKAGAIRRMVAMDGHQGPKEIGVGPEFFNWLTDPVKNGAGALFDFGCYGANLMTWVMGNRRPVAVTARTLQTKPQIYPKVEDDATVLVDYPGAQGVIQASWAWPTNRKDFEVYAERGYAHAYGPGTVRARMSDDKAERVITELPELPADEKDPVSYLAAVTRGKKVGGLSSLENNLIATEILVAARESARSGRTVILKA